MPVMRRAAGSGGLASRSDRVGGGAPASVEGFFLLPGRGGGAGRSVPALPDRPEGGETGDGDHADLSAEGAGASRWLRPPDPLVEQRRQGGLGPAEGPRETVARGGTVPHPRKGRHPPRPD